LFYIEVAIHDGCSTPRFNRRPAAENAGQLEFWWEMRRNVFYSRCVGKRHV